MGIMSAIETAFEKLTGGGSDEKNTDTKVDTTLTTEKTEEAKVEEEKKEPEVKEEKKPARDEKEVERALELFDALRNPETAGDTLQSLVTVAKNRGILKTEEGREEAAEGIVDLLKKNVHEDNHYMVEALGPALEKIFEKMANGQKVSTTQIEKRLDQLNLAEQEKELSTQIEAILSKDKYSDYLDEINALVDEYPLPEGADFEKHLDKLLRVAKAESGEKKKTQQEKRVAEKAKKNLEESLPSSKTGNPDDVVVVNKRLGLSDSIDLALQGKRATLG